MSAVTASGSHTDNFLVQFLPLVCQDETSVDNDIDLSGSIVDRKSDFLQSRLEGVKSSRETGCH